MPRLWSDTVEKHRREVRNAVLSAASSLVAEGGVRSVSMSQIAQTTGIGRATLYKYFPDVESILRAWHDRMVTAHLEEIADVRERTGDPVKQLDAVLRAYALMLQKAASHNGGGELTALLHRGSHVAGIRKKLHRLVRDTIAAAAKTGNVRSDITPDELAEYCLHALAAAGASSSSAAAHRIVDLTICALRPAISA